MSAPPTGPRGGAAPPFGDHAWASARPGGYAWWYFDAVTPAGDGLCCIVFLGSVFSPSYALRSARGERALPTEHAAVNLALYRGGRDRPRRPAWVMSEYGAPVPGSTPQGASGLAPHAGTAP